MESLDETLRNDEKKQLMHILNYFLKYIYIYMYVCMIKLIKLANI